MFHRPTFFRPGLQVPCIPDPHSQRKSLHCQVISHLRFVCRSLLISITPFKALHWLETPEMRPDSVSVSGCKSAV